MIATERRIAARGVVLALRIAIARPWIARVNASLVSLGAPRHCPARSAGGIAGIYRSASRL